MTQITELKVMQDMLKDLMQEVHKICEDHGLLYNLFGGSMLGAVRHQDIIPWDDDIDITMPRPDYERFKAIIKEEYADKFELYDFPKENYVYPYIKLCRKDTVLFEDVLKEKYSKLGLYIDIFPMDGIPETDEKAIKKRFDNAEKHKKHTYICTSKVKASPVWWKKPYVIVRFLKSTILGMRGYKYYVAKQIEETARFPYDECERVGFISFGDWGRRGVVEKEKYLNRRLYKFGQYEFWGIVEYDEFLKSLYGDYMTPPPADKRNPTHNYRLYIKK